VPNVVTHDPAEKNTNPQLLKVKSAKGMITYKKLVEHAWNSVLNIKLSIINVISGALLDRKQMNGNTYCYKRLKKM